MCNHPVTTTTSRGRSCSHPGERSRQSRRMSVLLRLPPGLQRCASNHTDRRWNREAKQNRTLSATGKTAAETSWDHGKTGGIKRGKRSVFPPDLNGSRPASNRSRGTNVTHRHTDNINSFNTAPKPAGN